MVVTWTSGYSSEEAVQFVEWGELGGTQRRSPAGTLTFTRNSMCGMFSYLLSFFPPICNNLIVGLSMPCVYIILKEN